MFKRKNDPLEETIQMFLNEDQAVRAQAIAKLGQIGPSALPALLAALKKDDHNWELDYFENRDLRQAIMYLGEPAFQALIAALKPDSDLVRAAAKTLALWGDTRAVEPLIQTMLDGQTNLNDRLYVIDALGALGDNRAFQPLRVALTDKELMVRSHAARALAEFGDPSVIEEMETALQEQTESERRLYREGLYQVLQVLQQRQAKRI